MRLLLASAVVVATLVVVDKFHRYWIMYGPHHRRGPRKKG